MHDLRDLVSRLKKHYGKPSFPPANGPFELILWENAVYLLPDERRMEVFEALRKRVGLTPEALLSADKNVLLDLATRGGMRPEVRVLRWRQIAMIASDHFGGNLDRLLDLPYKEASRALREFPNIGGPASEKILLYCGVAGELPLESNGLRVLTRFGFGEESKNYGATYKSVQSAISGALPGKAMAEAHLLLREHGKTLCKTNAPRCSDCPVLAYCVTGKKLA
jgi:endonuclease-3